MVQSNDTTNGTLHTLTELQAKYSLTEEEARSGCQLQARVKLVLQKLVNERATLETTATNKVDVPDIIRRAVALYVGYDLASEEKPEDALKLTPAEKIAFATANAEAIKAARKAANDKIKADQMAWVLAQRSKHS